MDLKLPQTTRANEEVSATLKIGTELRECMVVSRSSGVGSWIKSNFLIKLNVLDDIGKLPD